MHARLFGTLYTRKTFLKTSFVFQSSLLPFITKRQTPKQTTFTIEMPPKEGFYKLQIFARSKPRKKGRLKIPLAANFLVEFRHNLQPKKKPVGVRKSFSVATLSEMPGGNALALSALTTRSSLVITDVISEKDEKQSVKSRKSSIQVSENTGLSPVDASN